MRIVSTLLGATLLGVSLIAPAPVKAVDFLANSKQLGAVMPYTGTYIDWSVAGVSMEFDVGPQGSSYGSFFLVHTFDAAGNQINWIGQPNLVPTDEAERVATGVIARASGDLYYATNGPCIGCAAHDQTIVQTGVHFALAWATPRSVTMTLSGAQTGEFHLTAANFAGQDDSQFLSGTWAATSVLDWTVAERNPNDPLMPTDPTASMAVITIAAAPAGSRFELSPTAPAGAFLPPAGARLFTVTCPADSARKNGGPLGRACLTFMQQGGAGEGARVLVAWFDAASNRAGLEVATLSAGNVYTLFSDWPTHCDMYIERDVVRGHCAITPPGKATVVISSMAWVRLPSGTVRRDLDVAAPIGPPSP